MATINGPVLETAIHGDGTTDATVTTTIWFDAFKQALMKLSPQPPFYKVRCELWGEDSGCTGKDDHLYTYNQTEYIPSSEHPVDVTAAIKFHTRLKRGVLNEDSNPTGVCGGPVDEIYGWVEVLPMSPGLGKTTSKSSNRINLKFP